MQASLIKATRIDAVAKSGMGNFAMFLLAAFSQSLFAMESAKTESTAVAAIDDEGSLIQLAAPAKCENMVRSPPLPATPQLRSRRCEESRDTRKSVSSLS